MLILSVFASVVSGIAFSCDAKVVSILPIPRGESLRQVHAMLGEVYSVKAFKYVIYDNACGLAMFARNAQRSDSTPTNARLAQLTYVLDRWHMRNHTACLDPFHSHYLPEVSMYEHESLQGVNSSLNESFNAWVDRFVGMTSHMHPIVFSVFMLLAADLWNRFVVPRGIAHAETYAVQTRAGHLRRYRAPFRR